MTSQDSSADPPEPTPLSSPLPSLDPEIAEAVQALGPDAWWAIDIVPLLKPQAEDPLARFAIALVMAQDVVVYTEFIRHPGGDHAAELVVNALRAAAHKAGIWPEQIVVRGEGFRSTVQDTLDNAGGIPEIMVYGVTRFSHFSPPAGAVVDEAILDLRHHMDGAMVPDASAASSPTWMAWGVSHEHIAAFFNATADVYRAVAARRFTAAGDGVARNVGEVDERVGRKSRGGGALLVIEGDGTMDSLAVLFGDDATLATIMLFVAAEDWAAMVEAGVSDPVSADVHYPVSCISFLSKEELWGGMADEVSAQQWSIAGLSAYPSLWIMNADGGGLTTEYCTLITRQLDAIAHALAHSAPGPLHAELVFRYVDPLTGFTVRAMLDG
jgi:hypothetical protein